MTLHTKCGWMMATASERRQTTHNKQQSKTKKKTSRLSRIREESNLHKMVSFAASQRCANAWPIRQLTLLIK